MKKLLHTFMLLLATIAFGQPTVTNPVLNVANDNSLTFTFQVNPNYQTVNEYTVIYSEDAFFTPNVTHEQPISIYSVTGGSLVTVNGLVDCLLSGKNYYIKVRVPNAGGTTTSGAVMMTTTGSVFNNLPKLQSISFSNITNTSATVNLTIDNNSNLLTIAGLSYGLTPTTLSSFAAVSDTSTDNATTSVNLTGLQSATTYYVRLYLSNSIGCTKSVIYQFNTNNPTSLLYHFPFNGDRNSIVNTGSFTSGAGLANFVSNGLGNNTGAMEVAVNNLNISQQSQTANLPLLPQGNTSRSIAMRINFQNASMTHYVVSWGTGTNNLSYGFEKTQTHGCSAIWGNNICFAKSTVANNWVSIVITYDGSTGQAKYYVDGDLIQNQTHNNYLLTNTTGTNIVLGRSLSSTFGNSNFLIDDLKIYSGVLSPSQIATLSINDFQANKLKFSMYPNPANSIINIDLETELKSVEIYSLTGQKMLSSAQKQINISNLASGIYMIRVEDQNGGVATQKLIKN